MNSIIDSSNSQWHNIERQMLELLAIQETHLQEPSSFNTVVQTADQKKLPPDKTDLHYVSAVAHIVISEYDIIAAKRKATNACIPVLDVPALIHATDTDDLHPTPTPRTHRTCGLPSYCFFFKEATWDPGFPVLVRPRPPSGTTTTTCSATA